MYCYRIEMEGLSAIYGYVYTEDVPKYICAGGALRAQNNCESRPGFMTYEELCELGQNMQDIEDTLRTSLASGDFVVYVEKYGGSDSAAADNLRDIIDQLTIPLLAAAWRCPTSNHTNEAFSLIMSGLGEITKVQPLCQQILFADEAKGRTEARILALLSDAITNDTVDITARYFPHYCGAFAQDGIGKNNIQSVFDGEITPTSNDVLCLITEYPGFTMLDKYDELSGTMVQFLTECVSAILEFNKYGVIHGNLHLNNIHIGSAQSSPRDVPQITGFCDACMEDDMVGTVSLIEKIMPSVNVRAVAALKPYQSTQRALHQLARCVDPYMLIKAVLTVGHLPDDVTRLLSELALWCEGEFAANMALIGTEGYASPNLVLMLRDKLKDGAL